MILIVGATGTLGGGIARDLLAKVMGVHRHAHISEADVAAFAVAAMQWMFGR